MKGKIKHSKAESDRIFNLVDRIEDLTGTMLHEHDSYLSWSLEKFLNEEIGYGVLNLHLTKEIDRLLGNPVLN